MSVNLCDKGAFRLTLLSLLVGCVMVTSTAGMPKEKTKGAGGAASSFDVKPIVLNAVTNPTLRYPAMRLSSWSTRSISYGWFDVSRTRIHYEVVQPMSKMSEGLDLPISSISDSEFDEEEWCLHFHSNSERKANLFRYLPQEHWGTIHTGLSDQRPARMGISGTRSMLKAIQNFDAVVDTMVMVPVLNGDTARVQALLLDSPDLAFYRNKRGRMPLHAAAEGGHIDMVNLLLANKADVNAKSNDGSTPLFFAANKEVAGLLLANHADVNARSNAGDTPLLAAASAGRVEVVDLLLTQGVDINTKNNNGETALMLASQHGSQKTAESLIAKGAVPQGPQPTKVTSRDDLKKSAARIADLIAPFTIEDLRSGFKNDPPLSTRLPGVEVRSGSGVLETRTMTKARPAGGTVSVEVALIDGIIEEVAFKHLPEQAGFQDIWNAKPVVVLNKRVALNTSDDIGFATVEIRQGDKTDQYELSGN